MKRQENEKKPQESLPRPSSTDLKGRQSVRATFKLSGRAIDAISVLSVHLGVKQKSLFDHLLEDIHSLNMVAHRIHSEEFKLHNRIQKTFVISRRTLSSLDKASRSFNTPRDALVEYSIRRLLPMIVEERDKHRTRKEILANLNEYVAEGMDILNKARVSLGEDDPVYERLASAMTSLSSAFGSIGEYVRKGEIIEAF